MEDIISSCSTLGGLTYVRRTVTAVVGGRTDPQKLSWVSYCEHGH